ncbi:MAG: DUF1385 domain-containing protein [Clostridioides difficile]|nr:DUF1385 domain-containing protein [Clostridioides sp.]MBS5788377.1 DUF1385 domain-containing protein [Clostridioides difficile]
MKKQSVGGQAVIEGVMMQSKDNRSIAVRMTNGEITVKKEAITSWVRDKKLDKVPFIRGGLIMIETMIEGVKSLNYSSEVFLGEDEEEEDKFDIFIKKIFKDKANDVIIFLSMALAMVLSVGLFVLIPTLAGGLFASFIKNDIILNLIEGMIRICILFTYIVLVSKSKDIERVFQYHGAEHKSIHCYENDEELTVENARKFKRLHPRCGTNFLFIVMATSIILFSFFGWPNPIVRIAVRIICIPVVSGIAYEIIRLLGKYDNKLTRIIAYPGMMLQYFTTKDPDDDQLEVALESLKTVLNEEKREIL